jgi:hypothetical protein
VVDGKRLVNHGYSRDRATNGPKSSLEWKDCARLATGNRLREGRNTPGLFPPTVLAWSLTVKGRPPIQAGE